MSEAGVPLFTQQKAINNKTKEKHHLGPNHRWGAFLMCIIKGVG